MTAPLSERLASLGLHATSAALEDLVARATKARWGPTELLEHVADEEQKERSRRCLERRLSRSKLGRFKPMADYDWGWPKRIDREAVESALQLDFMEGSRNVVIVAPQGLGKTMIAQNIAHQDRPRHAPRGHHHHRGPELPPQGRRTERHRAQGEDEALSLTPGRRTRTARPPPRSKFPRSLVNANRCKRYEYFYYGCDRRDPVDTGRPERCNARRVRADELERVVWGALCDWLKNPSMLLEEVSAWQDSRRGAQAEDRDRARLEGACRQLQGDKLSVWSMPTSRAPSR